MRVQGVLSLEQAKAMIRRCGPASLTEEQLDVFVSFDFNKFGQQNGPRVSGVHGHSSLSSLLFLSPSHPPTPLCVCLRARACVRDVTGCLAVRYYQVQHLYERGIQD